MATVAHRRSIRASARAPLEGDDRAPRRHIGRTGLLFAAAGSIIGAFAR